MLNLTNNRGIGMFFGGKYSGDYAQWIQVSDVGNLGVNYPLLLNPNGGNVGIGTSSPSVLLHLAKASAANQLWLQSTTGTNPAYMNFINSGGNNYFGVDNSTGTGLFATGGAAYGFSMVTESAYPILFGTNNTERMRISSAGVVTITGLGTGTVTATSGVLSAVSDMNLKIEDGFIDNALEKVLKLKPRYYHWKEESGLPTDLRQLGFYAQEVNEALGEEAANTPKKENDKWGIYDRGMIAFLTAAIQEQQAQIEELKALIKNK